MRTNWNSRQGRRNYFLKVFWYSAEVYKANEKVLSIKFSPNSKGYNDLKKPHLPKDYRIAGIDDFFTSHKGIVEGQVVKIIYYKEKPTDEFFSIKEEPMFKKDRITGDMVPMKREDFYDDSEMTNPENEQRFPEPSGILHCKINGALGSNTQDFQNMVHFGNNTTRLETKDFVYNLKKDDMVYFRNMWWRVDDVQTIELTRSEQYLKKPDTKTIFTIVR